MRAEQNFDSKVEAALEKECDGISASEELKRRIDDEICARQEESMKHMNVKKLCITVAAACLLVSGITVFATGAVADYFVSASGIEPEYTDYQEIGQAQKELGYEVDSVERFANGYSFEGMSVEMMDAYSEETGRMYSIPSMDIKYQKDGCKLDLLINETVEMDTQSKQPDATREYNGITLRYDEYTQKVVPEMYELTEEDRVNMQKGNYDIVFTSVTLSGETENYIITSKYKEGQVYQLTTVAWEKDGVSYMLTGTDLDMGADEMLDMAQEVIAAK